MSLKNKKILFICPIYYDYHKRIKEEVEAKGGVVYFIADYDWYSAKFAKKFSLLSSWFRKRFIQKVLNQIPERLDFIFVIKGEILSHEVLKIMTMRFPNSTKIMYQWDSIRNYDYRPYIKYFTAVYSFDFEDVKKNELIKYKSLFFIDESNKTNSDISRIVYDLVFLGVLHGDRYEVLCKIKSEAEKLGLTYKFRLYIPVVYFFSWWAKKKFCKLDWSIFSFNTISRNEALNLNKSARVIVDINSISQSGLTIRTIETMANQQKMITTNQYLSYEPVYSKKNQCIINRDSIELNVDFFNSEYDRDIDISKYSLTNWLDEFFK